MSDIEQEVQIVLADNPMRSDEDSPHIQQEFSLPPTDGGKDAWLMLAGCCVLDGLVWSLPFSFGVFQDYYTKIVELKGNRSSITIIGTIALGVMYLGSPLNLLLHRRWPQHSRKFIVGGLLISTLSLTAASFATSVWQLILTQGLLNAVGSGMMSYPTMIFLDQWFVRRKGLAFGILWGSTSFSGMGVPFFITWSLNNFSFRTTLRIWVLVTVILAIPLIPFIKPREPISTGTRFRRINLGFTTSMPFLPLQVGSLLQGLGYFLPGIFLPSYARSLGLSTTIATVGVFLINTGNFFGCLVIGFLVDRWHVTSVILLCTVGATLSVAFLWGFSNSAAIFCIFALFYGFFGGSFSSTWPGVVVETVKRDPSAESGLIYALLVAGRGIGSVLSGPLSTRFLKAPPLTHDFTFGYGSKYGWLILFACFTNLLGGTGYVARKLKWV
ncbi:putative MFS monocarboxylate transporter [Xylogone sp. PMI_703]|nr:putative MFS monocarboxylate transporter [Xylogone sp. PMI_703]